MTHSAIPKRRSLPKKIETPSGKPRAAPRKYAAATRVAPPREPATLHSAGKTIAIGKVNGLPLHPITPNVADPTTKIVRRPPLWRQDKNRRSEAKNAVGRKRPEVTRVIGATKRGMEEYGAGGDLPTGEGR